MSNSTNEQTDAEFWARVTEAVSSRWRDKPDRTRKLLRFNDSKPNNAVLKEVLADPRGRSEILREMRTMLFSVVFGTALVRFGREESEESLKALAYSVVNEPGVELLSVALQIPNHRLPTRASACPHRDALFLLLACLEVQAQGVDGAFDSMLRGFAHSFLYGATQAMFTIKRRRLPKAKVSASISALLSRSGGSPPPTGHPALKGGPSEGTVSLSSVHCQGTVASSSKKRLNLPAQTSEARLPTNDLCSTETGSRRVAYPSTTASTAKTNPEKRPLADVTFAHDDRLSLQPHKRARRSPPFNPSQPRPCSSCSVSLHTSPTTLTTSLCDRHSLTSVDSCSPAVCSTTTELTTEQPLFLVDTDDNSNDGRSLPKRQEAPSLLAPAPVLHTGISSNSGNILATRSPNTCDNLELQSDGFLAPFKMDPKVDFEWEMDRTVVLPTIASYFAVINPVRSFASTTMAEHLQIVRLPPEAELDSMSEIRAMEHRLGEMVNKARSMDAHARSRVLNLFSIAHGYLDKPCTSVPREH